MFKVNNRITRKWCEICSKLTLKHWHRSCVFIVNFEHISCLFLLFLLLTLSKYMLPSFVALLCFTFSCICIKVIRSRKNVSYWYPFFANKSNWNVNWSIWNLLHTSKRYFRFTIQLKSRFKHNMSFSGKLVTGSTYILWQISGCGNSKTTKTRFYCMKYCNFLYLSQMSSTTNKMQTIWSIQFTNTSHQFQQSSFF